MGIFLFLALYLELIEIFISRYFNRTTTGALEAIGFVLVLALRSPFCGVDLLSGGSMLSASYYGVFDLIHYYGMKDIIQGSFTSHFEIGFLILTKIVSLLTDSFQVYLAIISIIQFIPIAFLFSKYSSNITLSFFVFAGLGFYVFYFSGLRQAIAMSVILFAADRLFCKKNLQFFLLVILAASFHSSAIVFLIIWPLSKIKMPPFAAFCAIIVLILLIPIYKTLSERFLLLAFGEGKYETYIQEGGSAITMFIVYCILFLSSFMSKRNDEYISYIRWLVFLGVAGQSLGMIGSGTITRIGYYFNVFFTLLLPEVVTSFKDIKTRRFVTMIGIILLCIFFYLTTKDGYLDVVPYNFFWERPIQ